LYRNVSRKALGSMKGRQLGNHSKIRANPRKTPIKDLDLNNKQKVKTNSIKTFLNTSNYY